MPLCSFNYLLYLVVQVLITHLHVVGSSQQGGVILIRALRLPPSIRIVVVKQGLSVQEILGSLVGEQSEGGAERAGGRQEVEVAALQSVISLPCLVFTALRAEDDLSAAITGQTSHHGYQAAGTVGGQSSEVEDGGYWPLLQDDLANLDLLLSLALCRCQYCRRL